MYTTPLSHVIYQQIFYWLHIYNFIERKIIELSCKTLLVDVSEYLLDSIIYPSRLTANV